MNNRYVNTHTDEDGVWLSKEGEYILIHTKEDAEAIIESLQRMIKAMSPEENDIPVSPI